MKSQVIGTEALLGDPAWSILRGMAREGRWDRARAARRDAAETAGAADPADENAAPAPPAPQATATVTTTATTARTGDRRGQREPDPAPAVAPEPDLTQDGAEPEASRFRLGDLTPFLLVRSAHPRQALITAVGMTVAAALAGRPSRELLLILGTVLVGQVILGWFNDLVDRKRDARHRLTGKPLADGRLDPGTVWFCLALAVFRVVPLSVGNGRYAGSAYLLSLAIGLLGQWVWLRKGFLSWLPWAAAFSLYPAFISYGGWGGQEKGSPPELLITGLAALLGIGVHLLTALWGLVPDHEDGWTYLPLKLGLKLGATRLLALSTLYVIGIIVALAVVGSNVGLSK